MGEYKNYESRQKRQQRVKELQKKGYKVSMSYNFTRMNSNSRSRSPVRSNFVVSESI